MSKEFDEILLHYGVKGMKWDKEKLDNKSNTSNMSRQRSAQKASIDDKAKKAKIISDLKKMKISKLKDIEKNEIAKSFMVGRLITRNVEKKKELNRKYPSTAPLKILGPEKSRKQKIMDAIDRIMTGGTSSVTKKKKKP